MAKHHHSVELAMYLFVNGIPFIHTKSRNIYFRSVQTCSSRGKYEIISRLKQVKKNYKYIGFTIPYFHGDNEFEHIHNVLAPSNIHT